MLAACWALLRRDLILAGRNPSDFMTPLIFFIVVTTLFSFAVNTDRAILAVIGPGVIWTSALLAVMLSLDTVFQSDFEDGTLEQILLSPIPLSALVLAKILAHWIVTGLPLMLSSPILGILMSLDSYSILTLAIAIAISTPIFSLIGALGASLVIIHKKAGILLSLLTLPLCIPVLIFSMSAVISASEGLPVGGHLTLLAAFFVFALSTAPFAIAATLRIMMSN